MLDVNSSAFLPHVLIGLTGIRKRFMKYDYLWKEIRVGSGMVLPFLFCRRSPLPLQILDGKGKANSLSFRKQWAEAYAQSSNIAECFVNGILFHIRCKTPHDVEHPSGKEAVGLVIWRQDNEIRTDDFCLIQRKASGNSHFLGGITGAGHNAPFSACYHGFPFQLGMNQLFAGGKEGVTVSICTMALGQEERLKMMSLTTPVYRTFVLLPRWQKTYCQWFS